MTNTYTGNATADGEIRYLSSGIPVAQFTLAIEHRKKVGDKWETESTTFLRCTAWRDLAERVGESVRKGDRVVVVGRLKSRTVEKDDGSKATYFEVDAEDVALSMRFATVTAQRATRGAVAAEVDPWAVSSDDGAPF